MENASKALLIAGGILISLIILTVFILIFNRTARIQKEQEEKTKIEQLAAFNAEYEAFNKKVMYGVDVITLINKVEENNIKYSNITDYKINVYLNGNLISDSNVLITENKEEYLFKCTKITYNQLGRVSEIEIVDFN